MIRREIKFMYVPESTINYAPNISPESMSSLFTDPPFSLQSPSSARGKIWTAGDLLTARSLTLASLADVFEMNEKKKKTTSLYRLTDVCIKVWLITFSSILVVWVFIATKCFPSSLSRSMMRKLSMFPHACITKRLKVAFNCCTNFTWYGRKFYAVNKIKAMYEESPVNVKVEGGSTFMFKRNFLFIASISFSHVNFTRKRT